jgi:hypothetical protein
VKGQTATLSANRWRTAQTAISNTAGGLAVCFSVLLIKLNTTPPLGGGLLGGLPAFLGGQPYSATPDRQTASGVAGVAK